VRRGVERVNSLRGNMAGNPGFSIYTCLGLPLLFESAYFLPPLVGRGPYFLPSDHLTRLLVVPALCAVAVGIVLAQLMAVAARRWFSPRVTTSLTVLGLAVLTVIGIKGIFFAAGYDWRILVPRTWQARISLNELRLAIFAAALLIVWIGRGRLPMVNRLLGSLGLAFGALAAVRMLVLLSGQTTAQALAPATGIEHASDAHGSVAAASVAHDERSRRVVWVIFDETDFGSVFSPDRPAHLELPNLQRLAKTAVFATDANSPASETLYSIPALLMGAPLGGSGIEIDRTGSLHLNRPDGTALLFGGAGSIFGTLSASGRTASVLGFYHPYCRFFKLARCDSFAWPEIGGVYAPLMANSPDLISAAFRHIDYWETITRDSLQLLPEYLSRDDALTFVHLNFPHLPAIYADKAMHVAATPDLRIEYDHNLLLTDRVVGQIVRQLETENARREVLLVLSTDHWLRRSSLGLGGPESSRPVPFIVWRVAESKGIVVSKPLSTVHTSSMILDYLDGKLTSQADIARWWSEQPVYPTFVVPETR